MNLIEINEWISSAKIIGMGGQKYDSGKLIEYYNIYEKDSKFYRIYFNGAGEIQCRWDSLKIKWVNDEYEVILHDEYFTLDQMNKWIESSVFVENGGQKYNEEEELISHYRIYENAGEHYLVSFGPNNTILEILDNDISRGWYTPRKVVSKTTLVPKTEWVLV